MNINDQKHLDVWQLSIGSSVISTLSISLIAKDKQKLAKWAEMLPFMQVAA